MRTDRWVRVCFLTDSGGFSCVQSNELTQLYIEAQDNVKFLSTLERHFKVGRCDSCDFYLTDSSRSNRHSLP